MANEVERLFVCFFAICLSSLVKYLFMFFLKSNWIVCFLNFYSGVIYIFYMIEYMVYKYARYFSSLSFHTLQGFYRTIVFNFLK
jgi:hypothetical protein